jgi:c-di-AMP phosphodiesterase-like protein
VKKRVRFLTTDVICVSGALAVANVFAFIVDFRLGLAALLGALLLIVLYVTLVTLRRIRLQQLVMKTLSEPEESTYLNTMAIPTALATPSGSVKWANLAFRNLAGFGALRNIERMLPGIGRPDKDKKIIIGGKAYKKELTALQHRGRELLLYRLIDLENTVEAKKMYQNFLPVVCFVQIDNYDELAAEVQQTELTELVAAVERRVAAMAKSVSSYFTRVDRGRYLCVFERRFLSTLRSTRFRILDEVRQIKAVFSPTLSIAVGVGDTPEQSGEYAGKALELALGRGGDQAVIKQGDQFVFFGGATRAVFRRSKVKSRMISHALRNLMEQCSDIFVMGHEVPDLDCIGASMGICACARHVGKRVYLVIDNPNPSIELLMEKIRSTDAYASSILSGQEAAMRISPSSMLVVVDTQLSGFTVSPGLLEMADTLVVIDHHIRGTSSIENAALFYHDPYSSSACELVTEVMQYFGEDLKPLPIDLEALLCGITLDTKGFSFNTGVRTFEAASYLRRLGADTTVTRQLVQDDLKTYLAKTEIVKSAEIVDGVAIAVCPEGLSKASLIVAQAADALLTIRGIIASFVVSRVDDSVAISGRSLGDVNVQLILESLGGGGHATIAAVKLPGTDVAEAVARLKKAIKKYMKEG